MVMLSFVLQRMRSGAQLVVIGQVDPDSEGHISIRNIRQLLLVSSPGKQEKLPIALFMHIYPHLIEIERNEQRVVYTLRQT